MTKGILIPITLDL